MRHSWPIIPPCSHACLPGKLGQVFYFRVPFSHISMSTPDTLYDEAIELQQAGKLAESITRLESLAQAHPDFALRMPP